METGPFPHSLGVLARIAAHRAAQAGIDVAHLKREAGLPMDVERTGTRVSAQSQTLFLNLVADVLHDDLLGFHIAVDFELRRLGPLYYIMASSDTLGDALLREERYTWTVTEGLCTLVRKTPDLVVETKFVGMERDLDRHQVEFWLTCTLRKARHFTGHHLVPTSIEWIHPRADHLDEMKRYFGVTPLFGASSDSLAFPPGTADLPLVHSDPHLTHLLLNVLDASRSAPVHAASTLRARVENAITPRLPHGTANQERIAKELGLSKRSLIRKLNDEGLTFREILDELRSKLAAQYLREGLPQAQIAWLVGFREPKAFARAFRRWTGESPSGFRKHARSSRDLRFD